MKKLLIKLSILAAATLTVNACDTGEYNDGTCDPAVFVPMCITSSSAMECTAQGNLVAHDCTAELGEECSCIDTESGVKFVGTGTAQ